MAGGSFSLTEKLAVAGAFLALVTLVVGTEDDPGLVVTGQEVAKDLRFAAPVQPAAPQAARELARPTPSLPSSEEPEVPVATPAPLSQNNPDALHPDYDPELGRVPRDFTNGPPES